MPELLAQWNGRYFPVPLQVHNDTQIGMHSGFADVPAFIEAVMRSFAGQAPADTLLGIKHHPLDRGYTHYGRQIAQLAQALGIKDRCVHLHDQHLPTLLDHAKAWW